MVRLQIKDTREIAQKMYRLFKNHHVFFTKLEYYFPFSSTTENFLQEVVIFP